jgi:spermidine/putrescine-binding protein
MQDDRTLTRRDALKFGALGTVGFYLTACGASSKSLGSATGAVTLNWETWNDHYLPAQLAAVAKETGITARPSLENEDSDGFLKIKQTGSQYDVVSADALWMQKYHAEGLNEPFDINSIAASSQLYPLARSFPFWQVGGGYLGYPNGWSTVQIYYDPAKVSPAPTSWHVLTEAKYAGKVVAENQPADLMAMAGLATGSKQPYNMSTAEIAKAQQFLKAAKPAFLKLVSQNSETVRALADGSASMVICNLGTQFRVKEAGGPTVKMATPSEGVVGFIDGEQIVKASTHRNRFPQFMNGIAQAKWIAQNFIANGRPLFNEQAYKLLVNQGYKDRADGLFYNTPERALEMHLKGPSGNEQAYIDAFNQVFGV